VNSEIPAAYEVLDEASSGDEPVFHEPARSLVKGPDRVLTPHRERAAARAVNSETPAVYEVLHQPREQRSGPSRASKKALVKDVIEF
jgi:hypothetical protein